MTDRCLNSLNDTTGAQPEQVLIINDGSPYDYEYIDETDFKQHFTQLNRKINGGYAAAANMGLFHATGDVIILANNDIEFIQENWLMHITDPLAWGYDICSIRTTDADGWEVEEKVTEGDKFGSIFAMKRAVYDTIGGFDEQFRGYFSDLDYHKRAEDAGFKVCKNHAGLVEHQGKGTYKQTDPNDTEFETARELFKKKHGSVW